MTATPRRCSLADLRLVLTRDDRVRVVVDGRRLLEADDVATALRAIADRLVDVEPVAQLAALTEGEHVT